MFTVTVTDSPSLIEVVDSEFVNVAKEVSTIVILLEDAIIDPEILGVIFIKNVSSPSPTVKSEANVFVNVAVLLLIVKVPVKVLSVKSSASTDPSVL